MKKTKKKWGRAPSYDTLARTLKISSATPCIVYYYWMQEVQPCSWVCLQSRWCSLLLPYAVMDSHVMGSISVGAAHGLTPRVGRGWQQYWPQAGEEEWGKGTVLVTTHNRQLVERSNPFVRYTHATELVSSSPENNKVLQDCYETFLCKMLLVSFVPNGGSARLPACRISTLNLSENHWNIRWKFIFSEIPYVKLRA